MKVLKVRDLSLLDIGDRYVVIAVDSFGGIGPKEHDVVKFSPKDWAVALLRVPLMEVISTGARPILVIDALGVEYDPTGKMVIDSLKRELARIGYSDIPMNGSTEDNIPVSASAAGIVILGEVEKEKFYPGSSRIGDEIFAVGIPKSGPNEEVDLKNDPEIPDIIDLIRIRGMEGIHDILPVGSHGILYESLEIAKSANLKFSLTHKISIDIKKSAGPSTCFLVSTSLSIEKLRDATSAPLNKIGELYK